jgi:hypothetical protein
MNTKEKATGKVYKNWTDVIDVVRKELNKHRDVKLTKKEFADHVDAVPDFSKKQKFQVGDEVHRLLETPRDALGNKQPTKNFRMGDFRFDHIKRKITQVLYYSGAVTYRYMLEGIPQASYTENQLKI